MKSVKHGVISLVCIAVGSMLSLVGCDGEERGEGQVLGAVLLGPSGGTIEGGGMRVVVPPGALTADTMLELRRASEDLSARDYVQDADAIAFFPQGLTLRQPAEVSFPGADATAILFVQDGMTVAAGPTAWINETSVMARAQAGTPIVLPQVPELGPSPAAPGPLLRDVGHLAVDVSDLATLPQFNLAMTLYDTARNYPDRSLNGTTEGDCGFELLSVVGGSLTSGCSEGPLTASIRLASARLEFDFVPFLAGKLEVPVTVGVVAGGEDLAYQLGFFTFGTSACFQETCSGRGTCMPQDDGGECLCDEGFGPGTEPFTCECIPQCGPQNRECGSDGCGGSCGDCAEGTSCDNAQGLCIAA